MTKDSGKTTHPSEDTEFPGLGSRIKNTAKHTAIFGAGGVLQQSASILLLPVYTRFLTVADYGILNLVLIVKPAISMLTSSMIGPSLFRSYYDYDNEDDRSMVVSTALYLALSISFSLFLAGHLVSGILADLLTGSAKNGFLISLVLYTGALQSVTTVGMAVFRAKQLSRKFAITNIVGLLVTLGVTIYLVAFRRIGFAGVIYGSLAGKLLTSLIILHMIRKELRPVFNLNEVRKIISYGLPFIPLNILTLIERSGIRIIIKLIAGPAAVGIFALADRFARVIQTLVIMPMKQIRPAVVFEAEKDPNAREFYSKLITYYLLLSGFIASGIVALSGDVLSIIAKPSYMSAIPVIPWMCLTIIVFGLQGYASIGLMLKRKTYWFPICTALGLVLTFALLILLMPVMGLSGAGLALAMGYGLSSYARYRAGQKFYRMSFETVRILKLVLVIAGVTFAAVSLPMSPAVFSVAVRGLFVTIGVPGCLYLSGFFEKRELFQIRDLVKGIIKRVFRRGSLSE